MAGTLLWGECTWEEVRDTAEAGAVAVAPFGSTEQHGPMLPLDTDIHIAERVALDRPRMVLADAGTLRDGRLRRSHAGQRRTRR